jgi:hypothetical protein
LIFLNLKIDPKLLGFFGAQTIDVDTLLTYASVRALHVYAHTGFPRPNGKKVQYRAHSGAPLDQPNVTPALLRKIYNISMPVASQGVNNTQAVFETEGTSRMSERRIS